jgi:threonine-phosphate decarboxylase
MVILSNPESITGHLLPNETIDSLIARAESTGKSLIIDEQLREFTGERSLAAKAAQSDHVVVLGSFSLFHSLAGLDLAFAVCGPPVVEALSARAHLCSPSAVATAGALASLKDKGFYQRTCESLRAEKDYLRNKLDRIPGVAVSDSACNFLTVSMEEKRDDLKRRFLERKILIEPPREYKGQVFLRVPIRRHPENARFAKTLARLLRSAELAASK